MSQTLRFCSWNIQVGMRRRELLHAIRTHPELRRVDVLALQEASVAQGRDDAQLIAEALGAHFNHYQHVYHHLGPLAQANGFVWNSERLQLDLIDRHLLPRHTDIHVPRAERALLRRFKLQPRVNLIADGSWGELPVRFCSVHLDVVGFRFKRAQFNAVLQDLAARPPVALTLVAGDFNTFRVAGLPRWLDLKRDAADLGLSAISDAIPWTQSVRALHLRQKLDEIFAASVRPMRARVWAIDIDGSDHLPVYAELTLD
jgi:endonuclease/exonuclease/phosphatase family metal-dependent hydrolase